MPSGWSWQVHSSIEQAIICSCSPWKQTQPTGSLLLANMTSMRLFTAAVQLLGYLLMTSVAIPENPLVTYTSPAFARLTWRSRAAQDDRAVLSEKAVFVRGGDIDLNSDEEGDFVLTKFRNAIRNVLKYCDNAIPPLSALLRGFLKTVESFTGAKLLPAKKIRKTKKKKNKEEKDEKPGDYDGKAPTVEIRQKKTSSATKKHLSTNIKSTNPNYRIQRELKEFLKSPPPNLSVQVGSNIRVWIISMVGAKNSIYEGDVFKLRVSFPPQYPTVPPSVYFLQGHIPTHEHVYTNGDICLSLLGKDWRPTMTAQSIAVSILSILSSAQSKSLPMDNSRHAGSKPGEYQKDWVYHDDNC